MGDDMRIWSVVVALGVAAMGCDGYESLVGTEPIAVDAASDAGRDVWAPDAADEPDAEPAEDAPSEADSAEATDAHVDAAEPVEAGQDAETDAFDGGEDADPVDDAAPEASDAPAEAEEPEASVRCQPGTTVVCGCGGDRWGMAICAPSGTAWGECACRQDAGQDAPGDAQIDVEPPFDAGCSYWVPTPMRSGCTRAEGSDGMCAYYWAKPDVPEYMHMPYGYVCQDDAGFVVPEDSTSGRCAIGGTSAAGNVYCCSCS